jgi:hypothetical protein
MGGEAPRDPTVPRRLRVAGAGAVGTGVEALPFPPRPTSHAAPSRQGGQFLKNPNENRKSTKARSFPYNAHFRHVSVERALEKK